MKRLVLLTVLSVSALFAQVKESIEVPYIPFEIKMGKGFNTVQADCLMCHSFGYILNQGPQSKKFWNGKIVKMIDEFKAPISDEDVQIIENYLYENYGNGELE